MTRSGDPLWTAVAKWLGESLSNSDHENQATQCAMIWQEQILPDTRNLQSFRTLLSPEQLASQLVLEEWFKFQTRFRGFPENASRAMNELRAGSRGGQFTTSYDLHLTRLFLMEFTLQPSRDDIHTDSLLHGLRRSALQLAACQRTSLALYESSLGPLPMNESSTDSFGEYLPRYRACLQPCYWLTTEERDQGTPFHLWDVKRKQTIEVASLIKETGKCPPYVAISHTWGRWQTSEWITIPGVPWRIPQNSKFKVEELPKTLEKRHWDYVWLDLFTIPQEELSDEMKEMRKREIARQASIFTNATLAIAWLKEADSWTGLRSAMCWVCFKFLKYQNIQQRDGITIDEMLDALEKMVNNFDLGVCNPSDDDIRLDPWFTSLWTLQEVCLRPDMWLYNSKWEPFSIAPTLPATLSDIIALLKSVPVIEGGSQRLPGSVMVLDWAIRYSGLDNLLLMSPTTILAMGYKRYCGSNRAEAIMSAIGITSWFTDAYDKSAATGRYPPAFINAIRDRFGSGELFLSMPRRVDVQRILINPSLESIGSLLPFGEERDSSQFDYDVFAIFNIVDHPSICCWTIEDSGSVRITEAGIVSSSLLEQSAPMLVTIHGASQKDNWKGWELQKDMDINKYLKSYDLSGPNYAVCIQHCSQATRGVILTEIRPGVLVRLAAYFAMEATPYAETQAVNWLVL